MEVRPNEGGDPGFLVHDDLVWICGDKTERLLIQFNGKIIPKNYFFIDTRRNTPHIVYTSQLLLSLSECLGVWISVLSNVIKARQSHPELSEDVARAHTLSSRYTGLV